MWIVEDSAAGTLTSVRWNPSDTSATLSGDNRIATTVNLSSQLIGRGARSASAKSAGKWYVEVRSLLYRPDRAFCGFDIGADQDLFSASPTNFIGPANMVSTTPLSGTAENVTVDGAGTALGLWAGDAIAMALDLDVGRLWLGVLPSRQQTVAWHGGGDPGSGIGAQFTALPPGDYYLFCAATANDQADTAIVEIPDVARGRPPTGFSVW